MASSDLCGRTLGEFLLGELIGEGGGGTVYRCFQPTLQRHAVVKVLREPQRGSPGARERFLREAQLTSQLDHPYAAHVYAFGAEPDGVLWIAMELVPGVSLGGWLREHGAMPPDQFVPFFHCIAKVVAAAHERGIVHRDLKPPNVMVIERGGSLIPKLLDFGIAKAPHEAVSLSLDPLTRPRQPRRSSDAAITQTDPAMLDWHLTPAHVGIGSYPYMAPEQWNDASAVGPAADIYSLGILAYEALTGRAPFQAESAGGFREQHLRDKPSPLGGELSPMFDRVITRALAKDPEARQASALELAADLDEALQASERELIRSSARQWAARARAPGLLWGRDVLVTVDRWTRRAPSSALSQLECSFVAASRQRVRRYAWLRRFLIAAAVAIAVGAFAYRSLLRERMAEQLVTQSELEQGRQALLHDELGEAQVHLSEAYRRGDRSPGTAFMLARALEPRKAEIARLDGSSGRMWSASFSPDGQAIVTTDERNAQVWDAATGRRRYLLPHAGTVYDAAYSADGSWIVTAGGDGVVKIWDAKTGALVRELTRPGRRPRYYLVAVSCDRRLIAAIAMSGEVTHVWAAETGALVAEVNNRGAEEFPALAFSADGRWLATSGGREVRVIDTQDWHSVQTLGSRVRSLGFDPSSTRLAIGTAGGEAAVWTIGDDRGIRKLREVGPSADRLAWSPDGARIVVADRDGGAQVFDVDSGAMQSQGHYLHGPIRSVEFDASSKVVLAAGANGTAVVLDAMLGTPVSVLDGPQGPINAAHFDPHARRVVGAAWDGTARLWDATPTYRRWSAPPISDDCAVVTSLKPDDRFVAIGCVGGGTRIWDTSRDLLLAELPGMPSGDDEFAPALPAVSSDGQRAAVARGNNVEVYELPGGAVLRTIPHSAPVTAVAFATAGRDLVSGAADGSVLVTPDSRAEVALPRGGGGIDAAAILADGRVVVADAGKHLRVYAPGGTRTLADLSAPTRIGRLRTSEDGRRLVTLASYVADTAPPALWDLERYHLLATLEGHAGRVFSARFVRSGREILTAGGDGTARTWSVEDGSPRAVYRGASRYLADATLTPDGSMIIAGGGDGFLRFWDASSEKLLWTLLAHPAGTVGLHFEGTDLITRGFGGDVSRWTIPSASVAGPATKTAW